MSRPQLVVEYDHLTIAAAVSMLRCKADDAAKAGLYDHASYLHRLAADLAQVKVAP